MSQKTRGIGRGIDCPDHLGRNVNRRWGHLVFGGWFDHWPTERLGNPIYKLLFLGCTRPQRVDRHILNVARRLAKQVEDGDTMRRVCLAKGIASNIDFRDFGHARKARNLGGIGQQVVPDIDALERQQSLDTLQRGQSVGT